jgi:hypothetical protein
MDLFCFASRNLENIELGVENRIWAVGTLANAQSMAARVTKAAKYLYPGAVGLLYCNPRHAFTVPFIVKSNADPIRTVTDVWPDPWRLPFSIEPLGIPTRMVSADDAKLRWPIVRSRIGPRGGISAAMNCTGTTVFVPVTITTADWAAICSDLAEDR